MLMWLLHKGLTVGVWHIPTQTDKVVIETSYASREYTKMPQTTSINHELVMIIIILFTFISERSSFHDNAPLTYY